MELGELLFALMQKIIDYAEKEFNSCGLPATLQPLVMRGVEAHFAESACDHVIAAKLAAQQSAKPEQKEPAK